VLAFVGAKMLLTDVSKVPVGLSLGIIVLLLLLAVVASLVFPRSAEAHSPVEHDPRSRPEDAVAPIEAEDKGTRDGTNEEEVR
jgi:hypothetical protein